jgi:hypothetical protein
MPSYAFRRFSTAPSVPRVTVPLANPTDWRRGGAVGLDRSQVVNRSIENILVLVGDLERSSGLAKQFGSCETLDGIDNIVVSLSEVAIHRASRDRTGV